MRPFERTQLRDPLGGEFPSDKPKGLVSDDSDDLEALMTREVFAHEEMIQETGPVEKKNPGEYRQVGRILKWIGPKGGRA